MSRKASTAVAMMFALSFAGDAAAENNSSRPPLDAEKVKYDAAYSVCKAVVPVSHTDFSLANILHPHSLATGYFYEHGLTLDPNEPSIITLVEGPTHGKLVPDVDFPKHVFIYHPTEGYLGPDQMTFVVKAQGKKFKVIETVWVANVAPEYGGCPADYKLPPATTTK